MPEANIVIHIADWEIDREALVAIRSRVFIEEQNVPKEMEWDEFDAEATHFLAFKNTLAIACARLKSDGQIGRMAVLSEYRNKGVGGKLLQSVLLEATLQKTNTVYLHAQVSAVAFYEKHGFTGKGDIFFEANIPHLEMLKNIC